MTNNLPRPYAVALGQLAALRGPLPLMVVEAIKIYGVVEAPGKANNQLILSWAKEVGLRDTYSNDAIPWCGLALAVVAKRAGKAVPTNPLWALNWRNFGVPVDKPQLGDVLIKTRKTASGAVAGHVAIVLGEDATHYHVIGGNQSDAVTITRISKKDKLWFRRPEYRVAPATVRTLTFKSTDAKAGASEA
ncbi:TIGR02594 family protein [Rhizobium sp. 18065]|uniref:TIGR02594 family protein n=1 Tax=Rhizobium sp. 18065 TaxID=2681411 RepID=UPI00190F401F|nr:TIGR02594 family protein [Rhizobium sp. 18065]